MIRPNLLIVILALLPWLFGCSLNRLAIRSTGDVLEGSLMSLYAESDIDLAETAIKAELKMLEGLILKDPQNRDLLTLAARGFASFAMGFVEDESKDRAREFYRRGMEYGFRALEPQLSSDMAGNSVLSDFEQAVLKVGADRLEPLFWTAFGWGNLIYLSQSDPAYLADIPRAQAIMERVLELDESYYYGGAHLFLGTLHASRPPMLGGDPDKAREHFEAALSLNSRKFLMGLVYYASTYAVAVQNRELFEKLLEEVVQAPPEIMPEERLSNTLAATKARELLVEIDEYF